jgi:hypothetical protein
VSHVRQHQQPDDVLCLLALRLLALRLLVLHVLDATRGCVRVVRRRRGVRLRRVHLLADLRVPRMMEAWVRGAPPRA